MISFNEDSDCFYGSYFILGAEKRGENDAAGYPEGRFEEEMTKKCVCVISICMSSISRQIAL